MPTVRITTTSAADTAQLGQVIGRSLPSRSVVRLYGPLGSGKTTLVAGIVAGRGGSGVSSPTFVYHQRYETPVGPVDHFDLYRIHQDPSAVHRTGITDFLADVPGILMIEWPTDSLPMPETVPVLDVVATSQPAFCFSFGTTNAILAAQLRGLR